MARFARVVAPGLPHHVTQRGNRQQAIFLARGDHQAYRKFLVEQLRREGVACWAYCFMPNHVHLVLTPSSEMGMARALGEAHRRYTSFINVREGWVGHLFQGRYASVVMDERHWLTAARYVTLNPVRAKLVERAEQWPWSSARAHLAGRDDLLADVRPLLDRIEDIAGFFEPEAADDPAYIALRKAEATGRPLGTQSFVADLETHLGRKLAPGRRGPRSNSGTG